MDRDSPQLALKSASLDAIFDATDIETTAMRTTMTIDDYLLEQAVALTHTEERPALIREALRALIERESARRLARLGGTEPNLKAPPRRRGTASAG